MICSCLCANAFAYNLQLFYVLIFNKQKSFKMCERVNAVRYLAMKRFYIIDNSLYLNKILFSFSDYFYQRPIDLC